MDSFPKIHLDYDNTFASDFGTLVHREFKPLYADESLCRIIGLNSVSDITSLPSLLDLFQHIPHEEAFENYRKLINHEMKPRVRTFVLNKSGGQQVNLLAAESVVEYEGEPAIQLSVIDITEKYQHYNDLEQQANVDALSKLTNRNRFESILENELSKAERYGQPLTCLFLDIDNFKSINDRFGHHVGDEAIRRFAYCCKSSIRKSDFICRWGGEEFLILLPNTAQQFGEQLAERLRWRVSKLALPCCPDNSIQFTVSIGVKTIEQSPYSVYTLVNDADIALGQAKKQGKNQVVSYPSIFRDAM
ncbi:sensor domain-containing diguanylate cyclase [Photobacterium sanctipauli]|uniref:diguanylate cyclase n=1 Tax=Photobacterium sanctipauli TaxID=1342794 RepID=A0A2T3NN46_9GAMM|nr:sensor domain-containing diguanylate cyclase [Photobacterium sanctipauli]PSW16912.1 sensor domain-containing diguanylate cyclase [Photobacterium sanctipauli]